MMTMQELFLHLKCGLEWKRHLDMRIKIWTLFHKHLLIFVPTEVILLASVMDRELWTGPILESANHGLPVNCATAKFEDSFYAGETKRNDDYMIGRLNILRLSRFRFGWPCNLYLVTTSNGTILISSLLESPTYSAKLKSFDQWVETLT